MMRTLRTMREDFMWWLLTRTARWWFENAIDQFERVRIPTSFGEGYLSLDLSVPNPESFEPRPASETKP